MTMPISRTLKLFAASAFAVCLSFAASAQEALTTDEVGAIIAQAAMEAQTRGRPATIAVVDRVGNVLGVFTMTGAPATALVSTFRGVTSGLEGANVPSTTAAIAKAVTGAYLSSGGNAFSTRTANQIVQEAFNPGESSQPSGPLFGVQFSQLPCSDFNTRFAPMTANALIGPKRSPLGMSADPGGLPLYKNNVPVGGIGVMSDGIYGIDRNILDIDNDDDELIAVAGTFGFDPPADIRAERITVEGKTLRFTDLSFESLQSDPNSAPSFAAVNGTLGSLTAVNGYTAAALSAGVAYGTAASGVRPDNEGVYSAIMQPFVFVDGTDTNRFPPRAGTDGILTAAEVTDLVNQALNIAFRGRAQIRRPLNSFIQVTIAVVDTNGVILAMARTPDGPMFGSDVSLQKARTAAFFSSFFAAADLRQGGFGNYVDAAKAFIGPTALEDGVAFADRSGGNLSRPFYPDGNVNNQNGPFSRPFGDWSPFSTGLQLDMIAGNIVTHLGFVQSLNADTPARCTPLPLRLASGSNAIPNGIQIFPGSVPVFKNGALAGGLGVSGDGIDQDDMISFLGTHNAGVSLASGVGNAPPEQRADRLTPQGSRLRYVNCPFKPFIATNEQNVCSGK